MTSLRRASDGRRLTAASAVPAATLAVLLAAGGCGLLGGDDWADAGSDPVDGLADGAAERWTVELDDVDGVVDAAAVGDAVVIETFDDPLEPDIVADNIIAVGPGGEQVWDVEDASILGGLRPADGLLAATGTGELSDPGVARYDADGDEVWSAAGLSDARALDGVVVAEREDAAGTVLLDADTGSVVGEHPGRLAAADDERVVVVDGGDVVGLDLAGEEQWRTTVDERFGTVPASPDLDDLERLGEIDPETPEGRRELRRVREDNRALRDFRRDGERYFGADATSEVVGAVSGGLLVVATGNADPTYTDLLGDDDSSDLGGLGGLGGPGTLVGRAALDAADGTLLGGGLVAEGSELGGPEEVPSLVAGPSGTVLLDDTPLGPDGREVPGGPEEIAVLGSEQRVFVDGEGRLLDASLEEVPAPGPVVAASDDGPYAVDGEQLVHSSWDDPGEVLARVDVGSAVEPTDVLPVDGGLLVEDDDGRQTLYR